MPLGAWIARGLGWGQAKPHPSPPRTPAQMAAPWAGPSWGLAEGMGKPGLGKPGLGKPGLGKPCFRKPVSENPAWVNPVSENPFSEKPVSENQ